MKNNYPLETEPVQYEPTAIKRLNFRIPTSRVCFRTHWHERMELLLIRKGAATVTLGSRAFAAKEGNLVIIPPHTPHFAISDDNVEYSVVMFDVRCFELTADVVKQLLKPIFDGTVVFKDVTDDVEIIECVKNICREYDSNIEALEVISQVFRFFKLLYKKCLVEMNVKSTFDPTIKKAIEYIEQNSENQITEASLASKFGYSVPYFCKKFKENTGLSPVKYINIYRLEQAYNLIRKGENKIGEIASICGFDDANYFTRCFKSHFGNPPTYFYKKPYIS